jgi:hypothetical protein
MGYNYLFTNKCVTVFRRYDYSYAFSGGLKEEALSCGFQS